MLKPILLNASSFDVSLLHQTLRAFGLHVSPKEVAQSKAGPDTLQKVRALQARLNVPVDDSTLIDQATVAAIEDALDKRGLLTASRSFTVNGTVRLLSGQVKNRQQLVAFDLDLQAVATYRSVKNLAEIRKNGGFEFLGHTASDNKGAYRITFYDWQYTQAERKKADVVVYAVEGQEIIGLSRIVNSENYSDKGLVSNLDVLITKEDTRTEYEVLISALKAFLKESGTSLAEIAASNDQLVFTAGELDIELARLRIAAVAELLVREKKDEKRLSHELLYGLGRENITLSWAALYKKKDAELRAAIAKSTEEKIIRGFQSNQIADFVRAVQECSAKCLLDDTGTKDPNTLGAILSSALPEEKQRLAFVDALGSFSGENFSDFWNKHLREHPEFKDKPELISSLLFTQQLTVLTGNHQALVKELQVNQEVASPRQLIQLEKTDWVQIVKKTGVPDFIEGKTDEEKANNYAELVRGLLNAAFPTQRIARMVEKNQLSIEKTKVSKAISSFFSTNNEFDIAQSRIHDFDEQIKAAAGKDAEEVKNELMKIQRVFQVSPNGETMSALLENGLHSAYTIANIPQKSFIRAYSRTLGGEQVAFAIHQRASHISTKAEFAAMHLWEYSHGILPRYALGESEHADVMAAIENRLPTYSELFGSPDICECGHCNSVYSAAAYFVDLLRFLWRGEPNSEGDTPLDTLAKRRPDLLHLPLTCENTKTIIPYIDLANEVMEYYTANESLTDFEGYDTGDATAEELRANPQNFDPDAYRVLKAAKYPFTLPYHQPLDVIRTYSEHLKVSRYEVLKAMNPQPALAGSRAIEAECLQLSQEEYMILTGESFDGTGDATALEDYFGAPGDMEQVSVVREFLRRSCVTYTDLVELVKTLFLNPHQGTFEFLQKLFSYVSVDANDIYTKLVRIEAGTLDPADDPDIVAALTAYNSDLQVSLSAADLAEWVRDHLGEFRQVITLYEPESKCDLDTTRLRTIQSIYEGPPDEESPSSGISSATWSKIHRFIRLWRKLGWTIHETDLMLAALGEDDLTPETISKLGSVSLLKTATKLPLNHLAVLWGKIDTYGDKSLYKKLFLNKAVQQIDEAFRPNAWGNYLQDQTENLEDQPILADHQSAMLAAFRISEEEFSAILGVATVIDEGTSRLLDVDIDRLNLQNLSTIYRYVVLAKGLKMGVTDLCKLIRVLEASPFSTWDIQRAEFANVSPSDTHEFYKLAASTKETGFKSSMLEYILQGTLPADSTIGLDRDEVLQTAKDIRAAFATIEQDHPQTPGAPLTSAALTAELSLTFQPEIVAEIMRIVEGTKLFETITEANLDVTIPEDLADKYTYINGSGRLTCAGVMTDDEQTTLRGLPNSNANFDRAVDELYAAPETFISTNFNGIFSDLDEAHRTLLDHPAQAEPSKHDVKLAYIYERFLPVLKSKLRRDAITRYIAALIGLSEDATALLIANDLDALIADISTEGHSATYFSDAAWGAVALIRTDNTIDFSWGNEAPDPLVPADNFSVRWEAYLAAPASGEYTLVVVTEEADEAFNLYLDETRVLQKTAVDGNTSWEIVTDLNAAQMHRLTLEYAEAAQNAGVRLHWKTAATALEIIPATAAYPADVLNRFVELVTVFHRAAKLILGFELSETELNHLISLSADFGDIDFKALDAGDWKRIRDYVTLRNAVPQAQALLTDVFALANTPNPLPTVEDLRGMLQLATAWDSVSVGYLVESQFRMTVPDFKNEIALSRLHEVIKIVAKTGLSAETIAVWGAPQTEFDALNDAAQLMKNAVKAKYEEDDWLEVAGSLSDKIREHQKQALIAHLLTRPEIQAWGAEDADGLFEYFLIDVQMGACMDTSRIVQANSSVQMFVNRCLLNLENGVSPSAIDKDRWEWMKNYRFWEANRKVFLYPENWLEPEWRNDRSEFFKELESYLVQNDITDRSVEEAFRNYLTSLNEVANLEVCGMYREDYDDGSLRYLHVFARTHNAPYRFFYRRWDGYRKWSAWERVRVDIRPVEYGSDSGVHLIPIIWKKRLFLFWPEFIDVQEAPAENRGKSVEELGTGDNKMSELEPIKKWEIRLAWSEYLEGKWSPKQVSKEYISVFDALARPQSISFIVTIDRLESLSIEVRSDEVSPYIAVFVLPDIQSKVSVEYPLFLEASGAGDYGINFMKRSRVDSQLELLGDVYLRNETTHNLLNADNLPYSESRLEEPHFTLEHPFFFMDAWRTYFVRPVRPGLLDWLRDPSLYRPYMPELFDITSFGIPIDVPGHVPGDFFPEEDVEPEFAGFPAISDRLPMMMAGIASAFGSWAHLFPEWRQPVPLRRPMGLEFHTFYHPFSSEYVTNLNQGGLSRGNKSLEFPPGLMESDTTIPSDEGRTFEDTYDPSFTHGLVQKPSDFASRTYYKQNVCFDVYGANSLYNWELFFHAPLYIATRLSKNGKYQEAMKWFHYIFDPTTDEQPDRENENGRYWKVLPFKTTPVNKLEDWFRSLSPNTDPNTENSIIGEWRDHPFDPHLVASNRPLAYMKHVVIKYLENLIAWGDFLFRQDTMESVNEALQIYVIANHILGSRPEFVPKRGEIKAESYNSLRDKLDDFSNALVELENIFPYSSEVSVGEAATGSSLLGIGTALYFCIPANDKLLEIWDTVADRLFKIRHCQNIQGVERKLALFAPPIEPSALIQAAAQGLSLGSILADLSSPPPIYRFSYLVQKANEFCQEVKSLGAALLAALEKKDSEELGRLRASQETQMLELMTALKERQVLDAKARKENLVKAREMASFRLQHYIDVLGNESVTVPAAPTISATLTADSQLPADTNIATVQTEVDDSLVDSEESGVKLIAREAREISLAQQASNDLSSNLAAEVVAGFMGLIPQFGAHGQPLGVGASTGFGGRELGWFAESAAKMFAVSSQLNSMAAAKSAKMASHIRREQDWTLQANLAAKEIIQLDKQMTSADIQIQVADKDLENHQQQIENAKQVELFLQDKFTNQELYQWMREQLFAVYKQSYNLAYDMAKKAEKAYKYELGLETASFIQYGYWDSAKQGLVAGDKLHLALRQLEKSYLEENRRELELTKSVSLALLNPLALIELRETGRCYVSLPEEMFDLDFQGHYFRRIKSVSLSIPCIAGPYTTVSCSLRLLNNSIRVNTSMNSEGNYEHENDGGVWIDDDRFRTNNVPVTSIATSTAQNDFGLFEFNFRDERYLPFEGAGAISNWQIELSPEREFRQFDYSTISDVILHVRFTARESGGLFREKAIAYIKDFIMNTAELAEQPLMRMFSMKHEFPTEWHRFLYPATTGADQLLSFTLGKERFPFFTQDRDVVLMKIELFAKCNQAGDYHSILSYTNFDEHTVTSSQLTMPQNDAYGGLNKATLNVNDAGLNLEELDISAPMSLKLKHSAAADYRSLVVEPREVEDLFVVVHYRVG